MKCFIPPAAAFWISTPPRAPGGTSESPPPNVLAGNALQPQPTHPRPRRRSKLHRRDKGHPPSPLLLKWSNVVYCKASSKAAYVSEPRSLTQETFPSPPTVTFPFLLSHTPRGLRKPVSQTKSDLGKYVAAAERCRRHPGVGIKLNNSVGSSVGRGLCKVPINGLPTSLVV